MNVAILLFDGVTALDAIGPYEVLSGVPGWQVDFVAVEAGHRRTDTGVTSIEAATAVSEVSEAGVVPVPGGAGSRLAMEDEATLAWLNQVCPSATWVTSVCTGSLVLASAERDDWLRRRQAGDFFPDSAS
jgi:putative intracellular protease/amidase